MNASRAHQTTGQPDRGSTAVRASLALMTVAALAGVLLLARSEAAQSVGASAARQTSGVPAGNAERGRATYNRVGCWECHAYDAQSGGVTGPKLGPPPLPYAAFLHQLRSPRNTMPLYTAKVLPDADVADIYAWVQALPQPPKVDSIPLLK